MQSSRSLERPSEWPATGSGTKVKASLCFVVVLALGCVAVGLGFAAMGRSAALKYAVLLAVLFALVAAFGLITRVSPQHRDTDIAITSQGGQPTTEIRYSQAQFVILSALVACLVLLCGLASWEFALTGTSVPAAPVASTLTGLAALFFLSFFALTAVGRLRRGRVVLSPEGIRQEGRAFTSFLPWESFAGAKAAYNGTPEILLVAYTNAPWERKQLNGIWKLDKLPPVPMIQISPDMLAIDATLVYHLVRFYLDNPSARAELGTEASLQRARTGAFE